VITVSSESQLIKNKTLNYLHTYQENGRWRRIIRINKRRESEIGERSRLYVIQLLKEIEILQNN